MFGNDKNKLIIIGKSHNFRNLLLLRFFSLKNVVFDFIILSSASYRAIYDILVKLNDLYNKGNDLFIVWYYDKSDEDMLEIADDFKESISMPFKVIAK